MSERVTLPRVPEVYSATHMAELSRQLEVAIVRLGEQIDTLQVRPRVTDVTISFTEAGRAYLEVKCNDETVAFKYAIAVNAVPTEATVRAESLRAGNSGAFTEDGPFQPGDTLYVAVLPYAGLQTATSDGTEGPLYVQGVTRESPVPYECRVVVIASTATQVTVEASASSPVGVPAVVLTGLTGPATIVSGLAVGVEGASPQRWVFDRPTTGLGDTLAAFRAIFPDRASDADALVIPDRTTPTPIFLLSRARVVAVRETEIVVRYAVADPIPQGADTVDVTYTASSEPGLAVSPASGQTVTPQAYLTGLAGTYIDFTIHRPYPGEDDGSVTFRAASNASARVPDEDTVAVPAQAVVPAWVDVRYSIDPAEYTITYTGLEPVAVYIDGVLQSPTPASPITAPRPAANAPSVLYTFVAEGPLGDTASRTVEVSPQVYVPTAPVIQTLNITSTSAPCDGGGGGTVNWSTLNMPGGETFDLEWENMGPGAYEGVSGTETGVTSPYVLGAPLCSGDTLRLRLIAYDGAVAIAEKSLSTIV